MPVSFQDGWCQPSWVRQEFGAKKHEVIAGEIHLAHPITTITIESSIQLLFPVQQSVSSPGSHFGSSAFGGIQMSEPGWDSSFDGGNSQLGNENQSGSIFWRTLIAGPTLLRMQTLSRVSSSEMEKSGMSRGMTWLLALVASRPKSSSNQVEMSAWSLSWLVVRSWLSHRLEEVGNISLFKFESFRGLSLLKKLIPSASGWAGIARRNTSSDWRIKSSTSQKTILKVCFHRCRITLRKSQNCSKWQTWLTCYAP